MLGLLLLSKIDSKINFKSVKTTIMKTNGSYMEMKEGFYH